MNNFVSKVIFGRDNLSGICALCIIALIALGCTCGKNLDLSNLRKNSNSASTSSSDDADTDGVPEKAYLDSIIAETTADFNYAITLNDFSKMYAKASSDFKHTYTEEQFKDYFQDFVKKKKVIAPILAKAVTMEPDLSPEPSIRSEQGLDILVVKGKYATKPVPVTFEYEYVKRNDEWQLLKLVVKLV
ncbi:MAG TPA: hypothetical protein VMZ26_15200 [Pyrinomonadaceae bacterium]|nr:hypothetical protein [Pyrinomonadaceae bacterium]